MKIGTLAYATCQGLGILAKSFYDNGIVTDVFLVEHGRNETHYEWYPNAPRAKIRNVTVGNEDVRNFITQMDLMLFFETPFDWNILTYCNSVGVPIILMPMYECTPKTIGGYSLDWMIYPSLLDKRVFDSIGFKGEFIPVPVDVPWQKRTVARRFLHNAGHMGLKGRNGTEELLQAMQCVKSDLQLTVRSQEGPHLNDIIRRNAHVQNDSRITIEIGTMDDGDLYNGFDVFVFPEKHNGLSLPLQEACANGMCVLATDRYPMNTWLPNEPLLKPSDYERLSIGGPYIEFDSAVINPIDLAEKMDYLYGKEIEKYSLYGRQWAESNSWRVLKSLYKSALQKVIDRENLVPS